MYLPKGFNNAVRLLSRLRDKPENYWIEKGQKRAIKLFQMMAQRVPAYQDFLKKNKVDRSKIKTIKDFSQVPLIDKDNYLRTYPLESLCWDGKFKDKRWTISSTSGSTGQPFYFPREKDQDWQYAILAELYLITNFNINKKSTLYVVGFPMGPWIGGLFTYQAIKHVAERGNYKLSVVTPGISKIALINSIKKLGSNFDQVLIGSYGPFLKDIVDDAKKFGLNWKNYHLGFIFSAEGFTEEFRDYIVKKTHVDNPYRTLNHYGTVDLGTMSYETPLAILSRRIALKDNKLYQDLFGDIYKLPTLTQFIPELHYFESINNQLICSAYSGLPLVRYNLKDHGGVITYENLINIFTKDNANLLSLAKENNIDKSIWKLPFVYVYERSDFSVSFFAFQIYPETIRKALQEKVFENYLTGKFTMMVKFDHQNNQFLEINIELKRGRKKTKRLITAIVDAVIKRLLLENSEYRATRAEQGERTTPKIVFWPYEHPRYFKPGVKQKWVKMM